MAVNSVKADPGIRVEQSTVPAPRTEAAAAGQYEAELWCEFDCVAYVFAGDDCDEISARVQAAKAGEETWDYVRPLSRKELYNLD